MLLTHTKRGHIRSEAPHGTRWRAPYIYKGRLSYAYNHRCESPRELGGGLDTSQEVPEGRTANGVAASQPILWSSNHTIDIIGWSRGSAVAIYVANLLDGIGCPCCNEFPLINWIGLFDPVDRSISLPDLPSELPSNIQRGLILYASDRPGIWRWVFKPKNVNSPNVDSQTVSNSQHGDVGGVGSVNPSANEWSLKAMEFSYQSM